MLVIHDLKTDFDFQGFIFSGFWIPEKYNFVVL